MRYDDIYQMDEIKSLSFHMFMVSQNTLFTVIPFHNLSDCDIYTPPTTGREGVTEAGGERPARTKRGACSRGRPICVFQGRYRYQLLQIK